MPKSAIDATRFTPTTPHASAKPPTPRPRPGPSSSTVSSTGPTPPLPNRTPAPPGETPQQKVRRLREAAARARDAKVSGFDKLVVRGRVWADRAHRFTALSLIGITAVAGVVTVYALGDMIIHNRRKRREYFAQQKALHDAAVYEARTAMRHGRASAEQMALVEREEEEVSRRAVEEAGAREKATATKGAGLVGRAKEWLFEGLKREEGVGETPVAMGEGGDEDGVVVRTEHAERMRLMAVGMGTAPGEEAEGMGEMGRESAILRAVEKQNAGMREKMEGATKREGEREKSGGLLDRLGTAGDSSDETPKEGGGWLAFMSRR